MARKPSDTVQLKLRFPEALRRRLERAAKASDQSMNAEIIHRLEKSFRRQDEDERLKAMLSENDGVIGTILDRILEKFDLSPKKPPRGLLLSEIPLPQESSTEKGDDK
jgi:hypothetical protein